MQHFRMSYTFKLRCTPSRKGGAYKLSWSSEQGPRSIFVPHQWVKKAGDDHVILNGYWEEEIRIKLREVGYDPNVVFNTKAVTKIIKNDLKKKETYERC